MEKIEEMSLKALYRGILKGVATYPSSNRLMMKQAILEDVSDWKKITDEVEQEKATKKMRMLYGHITMWNMKMDEVNLTNTEKIENALPFRDINQKKEKNFIYF